MTTEQLTAAKREMAEFMGAKPHPDFDTAVWFDEPPTSDCSNGWTFSGLLYDSSWEWIHPVWEKFRELEFGFPDIISHQFHVDQIRHELLYGTPQSAFDKLSEGIKWYNQLKK